MRILSLGAIDCINVMKYNIKDWNIAHTVLLKCLEYSPFLFDLPTKYSVMKELVQYLISNFTFTFKDLDLEKISYLVYFLELQQVDLFFNLFYSPTKCKQAKKMRDL